MRIMSRAMPEAVAAVAARCKLNSKTKAISLGQWSRTWSNV